MIGLLAVDRLMDIAQFAQRFGGKKLVDHFGLLQRQNIGLLVPQKAGHQPDAVTHRIDVPSGDLHFLHSFYAAIAQ